MRSTLKPCQCGGRVVRVTTDAEQDARKVALWACTRCDLAWSQRLRKAKPK